MTQRLDQSEELAGDLLVVVRAALRAVYEGTAMPLQEGKTASGQMEKIRLYHTISAAPDTLASATTGGERPVISGLWKGRPRRLEKPRCGTLLHSYIQVTE
jgi:hypothetical protein